MPPIEITASSTILEKVSYYSELYGVSENIMNSIIQCESSYDPDIQSRYILPNGKRENSWGLVQINLDAHKNITKTQAKNVDFSLDFLASNLAKDKGSMWSCYR